MHLPGCELAIVSVQVREVLRCDRCEAAPHRSDLLRAEHTSVDGSRRQLGATDHRAPTAARQVGNPGVHQLLRQHLPQRMDRWITRLRQYQKAPLAHFFFFWGSGGTSDATRLVGRTKARGFSGVVGVFASVDAGGESMGALRSATMFSWMRTARAPSLP